MSNQIILSLSPAQHRALVLCDNGLTDTAAVVERVRADVLKRLQDAGLIKFRPYAKSPHWTTTTEGHCALISHYLRRTSTHTRHTE